jgi:phage terminase Nu1 subunit (DNA packaging protein)
MASKNGSSVLREIVTLSDLASLCVCSERTIQRLTKQGVLRQAKDNKTRRLLRGRYELGDAMPRFVEHLRDSITSDDPNARAYVEARARRMQASAESEEMDLRLKRGELIEVSRVTSEVTGLLLTVRNHLLSLASRITRQLLPHVANENENANFQSIYQITNGEVRQALTEASEFRTVDVLSRKQIAAAHRGASVEELAELECD